MLPTEFSFKVYYEPARTVFPFVYTPSKHTTKLAPPKTFPS